MTSERKIADVSCNRASLVLHHQADQLAAVSVEEVESKETGGRVGIRNASKVITCRQWSVVRYKSPFT